MSASPWTIAHATDLHPEGGTAFLHGVALAERASATLWTVHAVVGGTAARPMPDAGELLARWQHEGPVDHQTLAHSCCDDPVDTLLDALRRIEPDLLVVGTSRPTGMKRWLSGSVAESLALNSRLPTLFLPIGQEGFVSEDTGEVALSRVLIPAADEQAALVAAHVVLELVERLDLRDVEAMIMHVGPRTTDLALPPSDRVRWVVEERLGTDVPVQVGRCVAEHAVDLVAMATHGHDSVADAVWGSTTEQVLRSARVPLLSVPLPA